MLRTICQRRLQSTLASSKDSIKGLFSVEGFQTAYSSRLDHHSASLKDIVTSKNYSNASSAQTYATTHATDANNRDVYQHASALYNLEFAYKRLGESRDQSATITKPTVEVLFQTPKSNSKIINQPTRELLSLINANFGSVEEFKTLLLQSAQAINGDGYTWVIAQVRPESTNLKASRVIAELNIVNTYNHGSPLNISASQIAKFKRSLQTEDEKAQTQDKSSAILSLSDMDQYANLKDDTLPLLAIDASPKAYLKDYGVFGKSAYLENLWGCINWDIVLADVRAHNANNKTTSFSSDAMI